MLRILEATVSRTLKLQEPSRGCLNLNQGTMTSSSSPSSSSSEADRPCSRQEQLSYVLKATKQAVHSLLAGSWDLVSRLQYAQ